MKNELKVVGVMSGTSLDGVDFVYCRIIKDQMRLRKIKFIDQQFISFPKKIRADLFLAAQNQMTVYQLAELHFDLGRFYAEAFKKILKNKKWSPDLIGLHGQTVYHRSKKATLQIGEASFLSEVSGKPVIHQFRNADITRNGEGAPFAPIFHCAVFANRDHSVSVHNLGGISNLTHLSNSRITFAYDTGPANMPMDIVMQIKLKKNFDKDGKMASRGNINEKLVKDILKHPYFKKKFPKSCGREEFGKHWVQKILNNHRQLSTMDLLTSITEAVALSIANEYNKMQSLMPKEIYFCGGGAKNKYLLKRIQHHLPTVKVKTVEDKAWPSSAIEGAAFALLAAYRYWGIAVDLRSTTGATSTGFLGQIVQAR